MKQSIIQDMFLNKQHRANLLHTSTAHFQVKYISSTLPSQLNGIEAINNLRYVSEQTIKS